MMFDPTNGRYRYLAFKNSEPYRRYIDNAKSIQNSIPIFKNNDIPAHGTYGSLLFRPEWKSKREHILQRDRNACVICKKNQNLQVHHRQYHFIVRENKFKLPWEYEEKLLITLCESCHKRGHSKFKVPTINI